MMMVVDMEEIASSLHAAATLSAAACDGFRQIAQPPR